MIEKLKKNNKSRQDLKSRSEELITRKNPKSPVSEAFRAIRTNLNFVSPDNPLKTIVITSSGAADGKSVILANLAISMAQNGQKVIILDADLRKPMQHKFFEMTNFQGLSGILTGEITFDEGLRETGIEGVRLISTGVIPPNPAELLASKRMEEVLEEARNEADVVLLDTPPVIAVADASILASKVDGVILVVASHQTHDQALVKAKENLIRVHANIIGTILNKYPTRRGKGYYQYYYYYGRSEAGGN